MSWTVRRVATPTCSKENLKFCFPVETFAQNAPTKQDMNFPSRRWALLLPNIAVFVACSTHDANQEDDPNDSSTGMGGTDMSGDDDTSDSTSSGNGTTSSTTGSSGDGDTSTTTSTSDDGDTSSTTESSTSGNGDGGSTGGGSNDLSWPSPPKSGYIKLVSAALQSCALTSTGAIECWGTGGATRPPTGAFSDLLLVTVGAPYGRTEYGCAVAQDSGFVECWGEGLETLLAPPDDVAFTRISANGNGSICGIRRDDGHVQCWGPSEKLGLPPSKLSSMVDGGDICGVREADSTLDCWNRKLAGRVDYSDLPLGRFHPESLIRVGAAAICAAPQDSLELECFAFESDADQTALNPDALSDGYLHISGTNNYGCGVQADDRSLNCWGTFQKFWDRSDSVRDFGAEVSTDISANQEYWQVSAGLFGACAIEDEAGKIDCWGAARAYPDDGTRFDSIAVSNEICGLDKGTSTVKCVADHLLPGESRFADAPSTPFAKLALGQGFGCGLANDGKVKCWGEVYMASQPSGTYIDLAVSSFDVCAVRKSDQGIDCWSIFEGGISVSPPDGSFSNIVASAAVDVPVASGASENTGDSTVSLDRKGGEARFCALNDSGEAICWGCADGDTTAACTPTGSGSYSSLAAGFDEVCGILDDTKTAECWPSSAAQPSSTTTFTQVSVGVTYACGIRATDSHAECWGTSPAEPPVAASFVDIAAGNGFACGVTKTEGRLICWGAFERNMHAGD